MMPPTRDYARTMNPAILKARGREMLYDSGRVAEPRFDLFDLGWWRRAQEPRNAVAGRGAVWFVDANGEEWAIRHYRRGGLVGRLIDDHFLWLGPDATRPFREFRLLQELQSLGLPAPAPVAAAYERRGLAYRADLATVRIVRAMPLSQRMRAGALDPARWHETGRVIRRFHDASVFHADLNAHNILIGDTEGVYLIDFDRGRIRRGEAWKRANLERLKRSLAKISMENAGVVAGEPQWRHLMSGYDLESGA